jgi:hypothetical protein
VPLSILLEFTEPVQFDGTAGPLDLYPALRWPDAQPGVTRRPAPDGRSIRFDVAYPGAVTSLALRGQVQTARGGKLAFNQWIPVWTVNALMGGFDRSLVVARAPGPPGGVNKPYLATIALVAFLDAAPGGGARLRAASLELGQGAWVDVPGDLDLGLGPPSEPAILMMEPPTSLDWVPTLAWVEDGQVRLRMGTIDPTGLSFGPALSLNHDPESPARAARLVSTPGGAAALVFVETGPTGDELWARRWDGTDWVLHPGPINAGTDDTVRDLAVGSAPGLLAVVAWTDAEGQIYLRVLNL